MELSRVMYRGFSKRISGLFTQPAMTQSTSRIMSSKSYVASNFTLNLPADLTEEDVKAFPAYKIWLTAITKSLELQRRAEHPFHDSPYTLRSITVQSVDRFVGGRLGFLKLTADVRTEDDQTLPSSIFMRGGSVAMLLILTVEGSAPDVEEYTILTVQPRVAAGTLAFTEIPAGMIDDSGNFAGVAAKEIEEETGLVISETELIDMTQLTLGGAHQTEQDELLRNGVYPSPGACDEFIPMFLAQKTMKRMEIEQLQGKLTGLRAQGEKITLKIVRLETAWKTAARDAKTLSALCLYDGLRREGKL